MSNRIGFEIPYVGFRIDWTLLGHLVRDLIVTYLAARLFIMGFEANSYWAYLMAALGTVLFSMGYEIAQGNKYDLIFEPIRSGLQTEIFVRGFFDPLDWLMSFVAGYGLFCYMVEFYIRLFFVFLWLWLMVTLILVLINLLLGREIQ